MHSEDMMTTASSSAHRKPGREPGKGNVGSFRHGEEKAAETLEGCGNHIPGDTRKPLLKVTSLSGPKPCI